VSIILSELSAAIEKEKGGKKTSSRGTEGARASASGPAYSFPARTPKKKGKGKERREDYTSVPSTRSLREKKRKKGEAPCTSGTVPSYACCAPIAAKKERGAIFILLAVQRGKHLILARAGTRKIVVANLRGKEKRRRNRAGRTRQHSFIAAHGERRGRKASV